MTDTYAGNPLDRALCDLVGKTAAQNPDAHASGCGRWPDCWKGGPVLLMCSASTCSMPRVSPRCGRGASTTAIWYPWAGSPRDSISGFICWNVISGWLE